MMERKKGQAQEKKLLMLLACICLAAVFIMVWALNRSAPADSSGFTPPSFEEAAEQGEPEVPDGLGYSALDEQEYQVSICGAPVVQEGKVILYLTNPASNEVWLKVRIIAADGSASEASGDSAGSDAMKSGTILGESGLLKPGEYVEAVELTIVPPKDVAVQLKLMAYEPDTYYSAGAVTLSATLYVETDES